jgi:hypothetical protein
VRFLRVLFRVEFDGRVVVVLGVEFGGFVVVVLGVGVVGVRDVGVMAGFFVVAGFVGVGGGVVVPGGVFVMAGGFAVVLNFVFVRHGEQGVGGMNQWRSRKWGRVRPYAPRAPLVRRTREKEAELGDVPAKQGSGRTGRNLAQRRQDAKEDYFDRINRITPGTLCPGEQNLHKGVSQGLALLQSANYLFSRIPRVVPAAAETTLGWIPAPRWGARRKAQSE